MTFVAATPLSCKAFGNSTYQATAGLWAAGYAASFGKHVPVRYAAVRVGAGADTQTMGLRGEFKDVAQQNNQPDGLRAARSSRRLS